jgi:integrase
MSLFGEPEPPYDSKEEYEQAMQITRRRAKQFFDKVERLQEEKQVTTPLSDRLQSLATQYDRDQKPGEQERLMDLFQDMSKLEIRDLSRLVNDARDYHYPRRRQPKYGNLDKSMSYSQAKRFYQAINNDKVGRAFLLQLMFGLRIGELDTVEYQEENRLLKVENKKESRREYLPVHGRTSELMPFLDQIAAYSDNYLRNCFASIRDDAGLDQVYAESENGKQLYQYTSHSLRHTAITVFARVEDDNYELCQFSRHEPSKEVGTVATYRHTSHDDLRDKLEHAFTDWYDLLDIINLDAGRAEQDKADIEKKGRWKSDESK